MGQPFLFRVIDKAVYDYNMICDGDRILVGASGGKDSTALIHYFANRLKRKNSNFSVTALHIQSEITPALSGELCGLFSGWGLGIENLNVNVLGRLKSGRRMNCWWCSTQRRTELLNYALKNGYNKLALGHHLDDVLETLLMNMINRGELSTMAPAMRYRDYPLTVIRPLYYADVNSIIAHGNEYGYMATTCSCSYQDNSGRKEARGHLEELTGGDVMKKQRILKSLKNICPEYLP
ncbi:MAG: tRNA 2-thiocytidine biosynthesis protein TtcA [Treponema sp.]|nr:tRNA 2-thiocytidine biosynthesis protein TtcA [Treponema sp.]